MTVLFSVGSGSDQVDIVEDLLDIAKFSGKPGYALADPEPLILSNCEYSPNPFDGARHNENYHTSPRTIFLRKMEETMVECMQARDSLGKRMTTEVWQAMHTPKRNLC